MDEELKKIIKDFQEVVDNREGSDDPYSKGALDATKAMLIRLRLIL